MPLLIPHKIRKYKPRHVGVQRPWSVKRLWTPGALKVLKAASKKGTRVRSISLMLKRTEGAVRQKAFQLGLSMGGGRGRKRA